MSKSTYTHKPSTPRVEVTTGLFAGRFSKKGTGQRWAIGPKHTAGVWTPFAFCSVDPAVATLQNVRWINTHHWNTVCEGLGKPTPEQHFTS
jgi:hypothetical protein